MPGDPQMRIQTSRLDLIPQTLGEVQAQIEEMSAETRAELSADWLARLNDETVDLWTLGFFMVRRDDRLVVGSCGFKGPPDAGGMVEIAYGVSPDFQGQGYATEAADALVDYAFRTGEVRVVRAHTYAATNASARVLSKCGFDSIGAVIEPADGLVWRWERHPEPAG